MFVPDFWPNYSGPPSLSFRFSNFYADTGCFHVWSGYDPINVCLFSPDSLVNWNMQDCNLHGGRITLGEPYEVDQWYEYQFSPTTVYGASWVGWTNNLFENVAVDLDPNLDGSGVINCDTCVVAYNNLFKGGWWLHLEPVAATAGNWVFADNLFDQVLFAQDPNQPLDFGHNAYWSLTEDQFAQPAAFGPALPFTSWCNLATNLTLNAGGQGLGEQFLPAPPPYQAGTFGNYYLPNTTLCYGNGSRSPASAGLCQYTTQTNQSKESSSVSIGLHYVAANAQAAPQDTDGDGIPDYVEDANGNGQTDANETSIYLSSTDGIHPDASNVVYLDIDLSGDGLVGRVKTALGMTPLDPSNPLILQQVPSGLEPDVVTFELSAVNFNQATNAGLLQINVAGVDVESESWCPTNAGSLAAWQTTYEPPGLSVVQAQITLDGVGNDSAVLTGVGPILLFNSTNVLQFCPGYCLFNANAYLHAQLAPEYVNQTVTYTIQLNDPSQPGSPTLTTFNGSTSDGVIDEEWVGLHEDSGQTFTGSSMIAKFYITAGDVNQTQIADMSLVSSSALPYPWQYEGFDFAYMYTPTDDSLRNAFGNGNGIPGNTWIAMLYPVDTLLDPQYSAGSNYYSSFNVYDGQSGLLSPGNPGYLSGRTMVTGPGGLYTTMNTLNLGISTKNFYCLSHGSPTSLSDSSDATFIASREVAAILGNHDWPLNSTAIAGAGVILIDPYRFVFLDACHTMSKQWCRAFGIMPSWAAGVAVGPQAFVGWDGTFIDWLGGYYTLIPGTTSYSCDLIKSAHMAFAYTRNLTKNFFLPFLCGETLSACLDAASKNYKQDESAPLPFFWVADSPVRLVGTDVTGAYDFTVTVARTNTAQAWVLGQPGLLRNGCRYSGYYNSYKWPGDKP